MASKRFQEVEKSGKFILIEGIDYIYYISQKWCIINSYIFDTWLFRND